jgi:hypothetical protein
MKHLLIMLASLALFACGGGDAGGSTEETVEAAADSTTGAVEEAAEAMHDAMDKAEDVGAVLEDEKKAIDEALEAAE